MLRRLLIALPLLWPVPLLGQAPPSTAFAFVLLGEGSDGRPMPMARAVIEGADHCPFLRRASGGRQEMTPRQRPTGGGFEGVLVCETLYPVGEAASAVMGGHQRDLPMVSLATPRRIVVLGDSGCRGQTERKPQSCVGDGYDKMWPFGMISSEGAEDRPDFIIHVGDYNYRGTPRSIVLPPRATGYAQALKVNVFDTGDLDDEDEPRIPIGPGYFSQNVPGSPIPDSWANWRDDFFIPSSRLLAAAPWIFNRGNHELCSRAGPGWFYLLDAASPLLGPGRKQNACPPQLPMGWRVGAWPPPPALPFEGQTFPTLPTPPFRLRLGDLNFIVLDSSDAGDAVLFAREHYIAQFRRVAALLAEDPKPTWLATHRPIWGVVKKDKGGPAGDAPYGFINVTEQAALAAAFPEGLSSHLAMVIAGHMHRFQATGFDGRRPPQLVVGTGGMQLSNTLPMPAPDSPKRPVRVPGLDGLTGFVTGLSDFGALVIRLGERGAWTGTLMGTRGETLAMCDSRWPQPGSGRSVCALQ